MDADTYNIDFSAGNGAGDEFSDEYDSEAPADHDGRAKTRTGFDPRDASPKEREHWEWLNRLNERPTKHAEKDTQLSAQRRTRRADAKRDAKTFMSQLSMTPHQRDRVMCLIDSLDTLSHGPIPVEGTVLGIISLVANEDGWKVRSTPTTTVRANGESKKVPLFTKMMYDCNVSPQSIRHVRERVREYL